MVNEYKLICGRHRIPKLKVAKEHDFPDEPLDDMDVGEFIHECLDLNDDFCETQYVLSFDMSNRLLGVMMLSKGDHTSCLTYQREMYTFLLLTGAHHFGMLHNHPSGIVDRSQDDCNDVIGIVGTSLTLGISFTYDIVVGRDNGIYEHNKGIWMYKETKKKRRR